MEALLETISLDVDEASELLFKIKIEGTQPSPAKVRLVCETGDVAYMFAGHPLDDDGLVQFMLPSLKNKLKEGTYPSRIEVLIENKYFSPVQFNMTFKQTMTVMAEAVNQPQRVINQPMKVSAVQVIKPVEKPVVSVEKKAVPVPLKIEVPLTLKERYTARQKRQ